MKRVSGSRAAALAACGSSNSDGGGAETATGNSPESKNNAVQVAQGAPELSILVEAVIAADLAETLSDDGPFTILAPTNDAFAALLSELGISKDQLFADKALLTEVLTYHVINGKIASTDIPSGQPIVALSEDVLKIEAEASGALSVNDGRGRTARIISADVMAENAIIHLIDRVILPADNNVVQIAQSNADFSILVEAVIAADLAGTLSGDGPFTVFAPTNAAFTSLLDELSITAQDLLANKELLTRILSYHVVPGRILKAQVPLGQAIATVEGGSFQVDGSLSINDERGRQAGIIATDVLATNGVVHVLNKVILPAAMMMPAPSTPSIVDLAQAAPQLSILVEAVVAADLVQTLSADGPYTVFASTNDAFAGLLQELHLTKEALLSDKALLRSVLLYHVVPGKIAASQVPLNTAINTAAGGSIIVDDHFVITDARHRRSAIVQTDLMASNGVVHIIGKVLLP